MVPPLSLYYSKGSSPLNTLGQLSSLRRLGVILSIPSGFRLAVTVISDIGGNLIVNVKGTRVALDRNLAECVVV